MIKPLAHDPTAQAEICIFPHHFQSVPPVSHPQIPSTTDPPAPSEQRSVLEKVASQQTAEGRWSGGRTQGGAWGTGRVPGQANSAQGGSQTSPMPEQSRSGSPMEWTTVQHLDLRHSGGRRGASARPMQPHAAAFRSSQAIVAVAIGTHVVGVFSLTPLRLPSHCSLVVVDTWGKAEGACGTVWLCQC